MSSPNPNLCPHAMAPNTCPACFARQPPAAQSRPKTQALGREVLPIRAAAPPIMTPAQSDAARVEGFDITKVWQPPTRVPTGGSDKGPAEIAVERIFDKQPQHPHKDYGK